MLEQLFNQSTHDIAPTGLPTSLPQSKPRGPPNGAIIGGTIGGMALLTLLGCLSFYLRNKWRKSAEYDVPAEEPRNGPAEADDSPRKEEKPGTSAVVELDNGRPSTSTNFELDAQPTSPQSPGHPESGMTEVPTDEASGTGCMQGKTSDADNIPAVEVDGNGGKPGSV